MNLRYGGLRSTRDHFHAPPSLTERAASLLHAILSLSPALHQHGNRMPQRTPRRCGWWKKVHGLEVLITIVWVVVLYWGERKVFQESFDSCRWEDWEKWPQGATPHHLVFVADPQIVDPHTYPGRPWPLSSLTEAYTDQYLRRAYTNIQTELRPSTIMFLGDLFDGGREWGTGAYKSPEKRYQKYGHTFWLQEFERFGRIFFGRAAGAPPGQRIVATLPGNHDLGFATGVQLPVRERFETFFGEGNRVDVVGNHTFVSVDTVSLSAKGRESADERVWRPAMDFLDGVSDRMDRAVERELRRQSGRPLADKWRWPASVMDSAEVPAGVRPPPLVRPEDHNERFPTILLTHVPLYRDRGTPCGPLRERSPPSPPAPGQTAPPAVDPPNALSIAAGYQYQNVLFPDITQTIADKIGPSLQRAFSGDDHDYCDVVHRDLAPPPTTGDGDASTGSGSARGSVREITVKSLSWAMGVRHPGFLLASLWNPVDTRGRPLGSSAGAAAAAESDTVQTRLCLLPDQLAIFIRYALLAGATVVLLALRALVRALRRGRLLAPEGTPRAKNGVEGDGYEDEEDEEDEDDGMGRDAAPPTSASANGSSTPSEAAKSTTRRRAASLTAAMAMAESGGGGSGGGSAEGASSRDGSTPLYGVPLITHAGYFGPPRGGGGSGAEREKWGLGGKRTRRRRRTGWEVWAGEFGWAVVRVGGLVGTWYVWLVRRW
ncbi:hypothetical protein BDY21DRAFT_369739 [Lineolata rhizophorae]|uniref:Uncharacterized protein n=1 Tax=Lineolata rhizophorae TaxID=578093 RepID=A0A6A6P738_9PEZI|nr:hypothetical protein BDY21DRAFT_369739 [Lineolata rhizophorae]